jgi:elongation factor G
MLIEGVAEESDELLEKFIDDPNSITDEEIVHHIRKATIEMRITPVMCGASFKNKGVQMLLNGIIQFLPSPLDVDAISGINPNNDRTEHARWIQKSHLRPWHLKLQPTHLWGA